MKTASKMIRAARIAGLAAVLLWTGALKASTPTPASFGVDLPTFTHLGFGGNNETIKAYAQVSPLQRLSGVQTTFGVAGVWSFNTSGYGQTLLGVSGSGTGADGRVLFDGIAGFDRKRDFSADISRASVELVQQLVMKAERFEDTGTPLLSILSLVMSLGRVTMNVDFPEESTMVTGDGTEVALGLSYEKDYLPGQAMHASAILVYRDMSFNKLFDEPTMNNDPLELQLRAGVEIFMPTGLNIAFDVLAAAGEAGNFTRYGLEFGIRYNY